MRWSGVTRFAAGLGLLVCSSFFHAAHAETRKVLFIVQEPSAFSARLGAEIETMGFEIVPARAFDEPGLPPTVAAARVLETPPPRRVELWIAQGPDGRLELSTIVQPSPNDDEASQTVRASEQLRAFFQPLREPAPNQEEQPAPPPTAPPLAPVAPFAPVVVPTDRVPAQAPRRFVASASLAVPVESNGPGVDAWLQGRWLATSRVGIGAALGLPIASSTVRSGINSASLSAALAAAEVSFALIDSSAVQWTANADIAAAWLHTNGAATAPYTSQSDEALVALPLLGTEIAPRLSGRVSLCFGARGGLTLPKPQISFAGRNVASWGRPLGLFSAGLSVDL